MFGGIFNTIFTLEAPLKTPSTADWRFTAAIKPTELMGTLKQVGEKIKDALTAGLARLAEAFGPLKALADKLGISIEQMEKMK